MSDDGAARPARRMRTVASAVLVVALAGGALATWRTVTTRPRAEASAPPVPTRTAPVTRGSVTQWVRIPGTYEFGGAYSVVHQGVPGILTSAPDLGTTVGRGGTLYAVENQAVRLLYGALPAYRSFATGMSDGPDVRQLERNLVDLGLDPQHRITVDGHFTAATGAAIRRWQQSWGLPASRRTGTLPLGQVVFLSGPVRISQISAGVGSAVAPNEPVLRATSTTRVVTAQVSADRQASVGVGDDVIVTLPSNATVPGKILTVAPVATVPSPDDANRGPAPATIALTVGITAPAGAPELDHASVLVSIAGSVRENVMLVPVGALLARAGGGYQVRLGTGAYVEVRPGLFDETTGKVEVSGGLSVGDLVEVPAT
jgi:peptidoglycan hydrolase-like protein with peptidoglycan-binding domain